MVAGDLREEGVGSCLVDTELVGSGEVGEVWRWMVVMVAQQCECTLNPQEQVVYYDSIL